MSGMTYAIPDNIKAVVVDDHQKYDMDLFILNPDDKPHFEYILLTGGMIKDRVQMLAFNIIESLEAEGVTEVHLLGVLTGAYVFFNQLIEAMNNLIVTRTPRICLKPQFLKATSYSNTTSGDVIIKADISDIQNQHVILVEDMIDSGKTLNALRNKIEQDYNVKKLQVAVAFQTKNPANLHLDFTADYVGFILPQLFVVGYGMDYNQRWRDVDHLCVLKDKAKREFME